MSSSWNAVITWLVNSVPDREVESGWTILTVDVPKEVLAGRKIWGASL